MRIGTLAAGLALVVPAACRYQPSPVALAGDSDSIRQLAGTWTGTFLGADSRRTGNIMFTVRVDADSAFGDVMMEETPGAPILRPADEPAQHGKHARGARFLAVRFVAIVGGEVSGALEPYIAPDCDCTVRTTFIGRVLGDTVSGTYETRGALVPVQSGTWKVIRQRQVSAARDGFPRVRERGAHAPLRPWSG
ncbi:MAG TPA: hypothetical protein VFO55_15015 [Gemmatimonadaceae bacterium]|nr:hypothetical protein [Gemmatimonadaceae bacterium]